MLARYIYTYQRKIPNCYFAERCYLRPEMMVVSGYGRPRSVMFGELLEVLMSNKTMRRICKGRLILDRMLRWYNCNYDREIDLRYVLHLRTSQDIAEYLAVHYLLNRIVWCHNKPADLDQIVRGTKLLVNDLGGDVLMLSMRKPRQTLCNGNVDGGYLLVYSTCGILRL